MMRATMWMCLVLLGACSGGDDGAKDGSASSPEEALQQGETSCGDVVCGAGTYCASEGLCQNGCTSDNNCLSEDECIIDDEFFNEGTCQPRDVDSTDPTDSTRPTGGTDPSCADACSRFGDCGMSAADVVMCEQGCDQLPAGEQDFLAACSELTCDDMLECLGAECFGDADCGAGQTCADFVCR